MVLGSGLTNDSSDIYKKIKRNLRYLPGISECTIPVSPPGLTPPSLLAKCSLKKEPSGCASSEVSASSASSPAGSHVSAMHLGDDAKAEDKENVDKVGPPAEASSDARPAAAPRKTPSKVSRAVKELQALAFDAPGAKWSDSASPVVRHTRALVESLKRQ